MKKKSTQLIPTEPSGNPYEELIDQRHRAAVDMRIDGERLRYIAERLKLTEGTIKEWFMTGGPCHEAYHFRRKQWADETAELYDRIHDEIKSGAADAIVTLKRNTRKGSTLAAIKVLEFAGFQPKDEPLTAAPTIVTVQVIVPPAAPQIDGQQSDDSVRAVSKTV